MRKTVHTEDYLLLLELLKEVREGLNLTQEEVAARLELTQSLVSKVERGERRLDVVELREWCLRGLKVPFLGFLETFEKEMAKGRSGVSKVKKARPQTR